MKRAILALLLTIAVAARGEDLEGLRLNQLQFLGSHNSYRQRTEPALLKFLLSMKAILPENPEGWDYTHETYDVQLGQYHVRSLEIDVYADPVGGVFCTRQGNRLVGAGVDAAEPALKAPGFKVLHFPDFDYRSNYLTFAAALGAVKKWSDANPKHEPVIIHLETKDESGAGRIPLPNLVKPPKWDAATCDALDAEIRAVFPDNRRFSPDQLRGARSSLAEAVKAGAWPTLAEARGKILFVMEGVAVDLYREGKPALEGRCSFIYGKRGRSDSAFLLMNDPVGSGDKIRERVQEGYFVRTRADSDTVEARSGSTKRRDAALASGAQIVSTDYYRPDPRGGKEPGWTDYKVELPGGAAVVKDPVGLGEKK
jgi:hypothetical protein